MNLFVKILLFVFLAFVIESVLWTWLEPKEKIK